MRYNATRMMMLVLMMVMTMTMVVVEQVVFDLGNGTYDAGSKSANLTYDEEGR